MRSAVWITQQFALLTAVFSIVLTVLASPAIVTRFRHRVAASMRSAAPGAAEDPDDGATDSATAVAAVAPRPSDGGGPGAGSLLVAVDAGTALAPGAATERLLAEADRRLRRIAAAYALAGAVHAALTTFLFLASFGPGYLSSPALWPPVALVFLLPVLPTVAYVLVARPGARAGWIAAGLAAALLVAGDARGLVITVAQLQLLIPVLAFLLFNLRYWRAVAPLVLTLAAGGSLAWLAGLELGRALVGVDSPAIWLFRLAGFALGVGLALQAVRRIGAWYRAKATSDQELFLDSWWAVFTLIQTVIFMVRVESPLMLLGLATFPAYWLTKRWLLRVLHAGGPAGRPGVPLLLLRVFGHDRRTERLLDGIAHRWRCVGPVHLIAGRDVALRTIDPQDFYGFLSGRLGRRFVRDGDDLRERLATLDLRPDPDGRYRINLFFCHRNTWKPVLDALVLRSAAVLMDLRGFSDRRLGCRYELARLAEHLGEKPVVLLTDRHTDRARVDATLRRGRAACGGPQGAAAYLLDAETATGRVLGLAARLLLGAKPGAATAVQGGPVIQPARSAVAP